MKNTCNECKFFNPVSSPMREFDEPFGKCMFNPPVLMRFDGSQQSVRPNVIGHEWCGSFADLGDKWVIGEAGNMWVWGLMSEIESTP